jgi:hypothetical protein
MIPASDDTAASDDPSVRTDEGSTTISSVLRIHHEEVTRRGRQVGCGVGIAFTLANRTKSPAVLHLNI